MTKPIIGIILIAVSLIVFPIVLTAVNTILTWSEGGATIASFTGLEVLVQISPLLLFIGLMVSGGWLTFTGFQERAGGGGRRSRAKSLH